MLILKKALYLLLVLECFGLNMCGRTHVVEETFQETYSYTLTDHQKNITWIDEIIEHSSRTSEPVIIIDKSAYKLNLYDDGEMKHSFPIELGFNPYDDKRMQGDGCTPEGKYVVSFEKDQPGQSHFYKALLLNYPNKSDWNEFSELQSSGEIPQDATIGGAIEIHGHGSGKAGNKGGRNWTLGCIAVTDTQMDTLTLYTSDSNDNQNPTRVTIVKYGLDLPRQERPKQGGPPL